jgi:two-component system LytT family response regulator
MRTLIVDDERLAREELRELLGAHPEIEIVGEASNGPEAQKRIADLQPDLIFLDIQMPEQNALSCFKRSSLPARDDLRDRDDKYAPGLENSALDFS